ncbi:type I-C CRISPR-associated protein Cas7/Csd2 [Vibrio cholerae]|uniref:Type I-C CRISPR-associated protein Cas7/Csd2 n=1 Tax=Vibrio cholerae TaxID=666 RepID=A0A5B1BY08_VIBCL|nr:type I-C CRISPR-associated protein Cas7/Csd2 [Vibrio cholerae]EGR0593360.1 type I-C CRISPR-associated protein Cas7/Csd2 [Vibrio cholerae]EGR2849118.1 type I-C CRISPR-associated protein Cas7/Csd2 [Vibrio cholerae]EGR5063877.1 type I-C CRISPR-associated protein Cas7/Csd2 [Vibrio cholerae]EJK2191434.1 type I-C CRISPR-associated protein Cas7/Csd2 [Vibrio cholerae]EKF9248575.1 type I-C CRISPR-associated protein Cas7/Csd2 [Vibrio cholerae]
MSLQNKIDFALIFNVLNANPNGDPLNGNRPRTDYDGFGEITDVCLKRKIRDRLQEAGESIFVQSDEKKTDGMTSLRNRAESKEFGLGKDTFNIKKTKRDDAVKLCCEKWFDVRAFGQVFAFKSGGNSEAEESSVSISARGPVTIHSAFSVEPVSITSTQITKSVNGEGDGTKKTPDTMGMKHRVDKATYVAFGAMTPQLAEKTGFSDEDAEKIKAVLVKLFEGDASSARPEGSMSISHLVWWKHNSKSGQYSSAKVHQTLRAHIEQGLPLETTALKDSLVTALQGLEPEVIEGF